MLRTPLSLPFAADAPRLMELVAGRAIAVSPPRERRFVEAAVHHGLVEFVLRAAQEDRVTLSAGCRHWLMALRSDQQAATSLRCRALPDVLAAVAGATGGPGLLIKGPVLAELVYLDPRLRPARDLDLVLPADQLAPAVHALETQLGYQRMPEPWTGYGERHGHHVGLARASRGQRVLVELHWRISDDPTAKRLDYARLAAHAEPLRLAGAEAWVPGSVEHLLVLAVHLLHEPDKRLMWINDIALMGGRLSTAEWEAANALACELGLAWVLERALAYVARHLGGAPPPGIRGATPPPLGPLRVSELLDGWIGRQAGLLALGDWLSHDGYLRSAARTRRKQLSRAVKRGGRLW